MEWEVISSGNRKVFNGLKARFTKKILRILLMRKSFNGGAVNIIYGANCDSPKVFWTVRMLMKFF